MAINPGHSIFNHNSPIPELTAGPRTPRLGVDEGFSEEKTLSKPSIPSGHENNGGLNTKYTHSRGQLTEYGKQVFGKPSTDAVNPNHLAQQEFMKHPSGRQLTASEYNDKLASIKNKSFENTGDSAASDKKFTEDLHSRKSNGRFIESSGHSTTKYVHKEG
jgi:hypothetical protein